MCKTAYEAESAIIDWIFEKERDFYLKNKLKNLQRSIQQITN